MIALRHLLPDQPLPERLRDLTINALRLDSRAVTPGDLFLAVPGHNADGRQFIDAAIRAGATVVVEEGDAFAVRRTTARCASPCRHCAARSACWRRATSASPDAA